MYDFTPVPAFDFSECNPNFDDLPVYGQHRHGDLDRGLDDDFLPSDAERGPDPEAAPNRISDRGDDEENMGLIQVPARATRSTHGPGWTLTVRCPFCRATHKHCGGYRDQPRYGYNECHKTNPDWPTAVYILVPMEEN